MVDCTPAQLHATFAGSNGAAGTGHYAYAIRNDGDSCVLAGYPRVRFVGLHGRRRVAVHRDGKQVLPSPPPRVVRLTHGARAGIELAVAEESMGGPLRRWNAKALEIRIGRGWVRLGPLRGAGDLWESPFLARVPRP